MIWHIFAPELPTLGMDFINSLILGCHNTMDERGCSRRNAPPIAWTAQSSRQVLQGGKAAWRGARSYLGDHQ